MNLGTMVVGLCAVALVGCAPVSTAGRGDAVRQVTAAQAANPAGTRSGATSTDPAVIGNAVKTLRTDRTERTGVDSGVTISGRPSSGR